MAEQTQSCEPSLSLFIEACAASLREAVQAHTGEHVHVEWKAAASSGAPEETAWWEHPLAGDPRIALIFGVPPQAASAIEGGASGAPPELLSQAVLRLPACVAEPLRGEIGLPALRQRPDRPSDGEAFEINLSIGAMPLPAVMAVANPALIERLRRISWRPAAQPSPRTMGVLMDVELPVRVSFGRSRVPLKDVLKLTVGSVLELNRSLDSSVDVVINNCVVAQGELVVVEGNYGIRIRQINDGERREASRNCA